jgi:hypothetical protein
VVVDRTDATRSHGLAHRRSRILADWAWARLDREIAAGLPIDESDARMQRARELLRPEERRAIAAVLRNILDEAGRSGVGDDADAGAGHHALVILASRDRIVQLIDLLRGDVPMAAAAVARAELLACDRHSPLVSPHGSDAIVQALNQIAFANAS